MLFHITLSPSSVHQNALNSLLLFKRKMSAFQVSMQDMIPHSIWEKPCKRECSESLRFPVLWFSWVVFLIIGDRYIGEF